MKLQLSYKCFCKPRDRFGPTVIYAGIEDIADEFNDLAALWILIDEYTNKLCNHLGSVALVDN